MANHILVQTNAGPVRGILTDSCARFLAIPYAAPPVGDLRCAAPQQHASWTAPLDATRHGPTAPTNWLGSTLWTSRLWSSVRVRTFDPLIKRRCKPSLPRI